MIMAFYPRQKRPTTSSICTGALLDDGFTETKKPTAAPITEKMNDPNKYIELVSTLAKKKERGKVVNRG